MPWLVCCIIVRRDFIVHCTGLFHLLRFSSFKDTVQSSLFYLFTGRTSVFYTHLARLRSIFLLLEWKNVLCKPNVSFSVNRSLLMFLISFAFVRLNKYFKVMQYIFVNKKNVASHACRSQFHSQPLKFDFCSSSDSVLGIGFPLMCNGIRCLSFGKNY